MIPQAPAAELKSSDNSSPFHIFHPESTANSSGGCGVGTKSNSKTEFLARELSDIIRRSSAYASGSDRQYAVPADMADAVYHLDGLSALPLCEELSHQFIDGRHLWIGVKEGTAIVLGETEHVAFERLARRETPFDVAAALSEKMNGYAAAWSEVTTLIGRLATSGFLQGIAGYHDSKLPQPERFARFHLTKACQLECIHCYADSSPHVDREGELSTDRWLRLVEDYAAAGGSECSSRAVKRYFTRAASP